MPPGCHLAAHLLSLQVLVMIRKRLGELPFEGSKFLQRSTDSSLTPLPVLSMTKTMVAAASLNNKIMVIFVFLYYDFSSIPQIKTTSTKWLCLLVKNLKTKEKRKAFKFPPTNQNITVSV